MSSLMEIAQTAATEQAMRGFADLMAHICNLYTCGESSSVSEFEGHELAESALYVLGLNDETAVQTMALLASDDIVTIWTQKRQELEARIPEVMELWQLTAATMPPIRNIALRDTLASIGELPRVYDTFFAAHEIPCSIDYPLSDPVSEELKGLDYIEAWLTQLLAEARFLAQFDTDEMVAYLNSWFPDYRGLLINFYEPIHDAWRDGVIKVAGKEPGQMHEHER